VVHLFDFKQHPSALALVLFIIIFAITLVQLRLQRRWVHYA